MGWWDDFYSIYNALDDAIWYIEKQLESWVESWAYWAIATVGTTYSILEHSWSDVKKEIDNRMGTYYSSINDFYGALKGKLRNDFTILQKSWYDVTNYVDNKIDILKVNINNIRSDATTLYNYAHSTLSGQINSLRTDITNLYNYAHTHLNDRINTLAQDIGELNSSVEGVKRTSKQMIGFIAAEAEKRWTILRISAVGLVTEINTSINALKKDYIDPQIRSLSQDIDSITDNVEGITKTAKQIVSFIAYEAEKRWTILRISAVGLVTEINTSINALKKDVIMPIIANVSTLTTRVDYLYTTALENISNSLDSLLRNINKLKTDFVLPMRTELTNLATSFNALPSWVNSNFTKLANDLIEQFIKIFTASEKTSVRFLQALGIGAGEIITTILDTPKDMVAWIQDAIADAFEEILDRVFR